MQDIKTIMERLEHEGYRATGPRRVVLDEIVNRHAPFTSAELWDAVQSHHPTVGRATVFRTLDLLSRLGVLQRIHQDADGGRCHTYLACDSTHHHHLICNSCGSVTDFHEDNALNALIREIEQHTAFHVEGHRLELVGLCPNCRDE